MNFLDPALDAYSEANSSAEPAYLVELGLDTRAHVADPGMISGHLQGRFLAMISKLVRPRTIVEIGTFTGYSALCLAEGLAPGGVLHTIDIDRELEPMVKRYVAKAGMNGRVVQHIGAALEIIPTLPAPFDLVFIDADKANYPKYFELVIARMRPGGVILADNVLWNGKVLAPSADQDRDTRALAAYARIVNSDPRLEGVLVPIRDGVMVSRVR
jgi:caffeoyl-CoA O-methyltransferase